MSTPTVSDVPPPLVDHPRYKIVGRLGEGGMGVVYKAEHRVMGRTVALKVLSLETITSHPAAIDRFRREVHLASRLSHPNIVTAYDADEAGGLHFLVMEYVDGLSLDRVVHDRGPLPVTMACTMIRQAAIGLQHAHEKGMVHRDIKPHNLMVTKTGEVKILDFGLARVATADGVDPASLTAMAITKPQTLMGTPDFLSPEQARNSVGLDIRSDLYSLGCTLYYLLAGKPPFGGVGAYAKMIAHFKEPAPQLCEVRPDASPELGQILQRLMAKSPDDRYQTPTEVAGVLLPFAGATLDAANHEANGRLRPRESWLKDAKAEACEETQPSYATDPSCPILPMASEFEASIEAMPAQPQSQEVIPEQPKPARKRWGRMFGLAALVVLGVALGGIAKLLTSTHEQTAQTEASEAPKQLATEPNSDSPSVAQALGSTVPQTPKTEPA
ncbi:MAG TPA: serine/threonine-protein kinase, partial [Gemmata sp.]|nr:serine/threonine-protein kinase [Gemmata sp.]